MALPNTHFGPKYIASLFNGKKKVFFDGIGGISMCSLAQITKRRGHAVSGYDRTPSRLTRRLEEDGITVSYDAAAENVGDADILVYTVAIPGDDPQYVRAGERGIPRISRADYLGYLMSGYKRRIGVSGTHGKSTTTAMLSCIFAKAGLDPTVSCGAVMLGENSAHRLGSEDFFIFEACEYMDSFLDFCPTTALILNVEMDHVDYFKSLEQIVSSFGSFADRCGADGIAVVNADDKNAMRSAEGFPGRRVTFSRLDPSATFFAADVEMKNGRASFTVMHEGRSLCKISPASYGDHAVTDSLAAFAAAYSNGVGAEAIADALASFGGVSRRMELCGKTQSGASVYSDYAHHPTEIATTLRTAKGIGYDRVICAFQPHTYSRTANFFDDFARVLAESGCDIILTEIYSARETCTGGVSSALLCDRIKDFGGEAAYVPDLGDLADYVSAKARPGDMVIFMGAGDIDSCVRMVVRTGE